MKYQDLNQALIKKEIFGSYLFTGSEGLLMEKTTESIIKIFIEENFKDLNLSYIHGSNFVLEDFYSSVETFPFMSEKRVVIIDELGSMLENNDLSEEFFSTLENLSVDNIVVFHDSDQNLKKTTKLYKFFKRTKRIVEFDKLNNKDLISYIKSEVKLKNKTIKDSDISYFIMLTGYLNNKLEVNLYDLESEINKIISFGDDKEISKANIDQAINKVSDSNIFNLLDSLSNRNPEKSLGYLHDLYDKNEAIESILYMIQRRYRHMYEYASLYKNYKSDNEIKNVLAISDYEFKVISKISRNLDLCIIKEKLEDILETDIRLKSTSQDNLLLMEFLIVNLCKK